MVFTELVSFLQNLPLTTGELLQQNEIKVGLKLILMNSSTSKVSKLLLMSQWKDQKQLVTLFIRTWA